MAKSAPDSPSPSSRSGRVVIVASRYNSEYTDALVEASSATIAKLAPELDVDIIRVPGAFEIPVVVEAAACQEEPPAAILALGVIIRGSTAHADLIAQTITKTLQETSVSHLIPVIHEVLLVDTAEQAEARSLGDELNRGREAAESAISMIDVMDTMLGASPPES
ncbi:MAG: 6,7-dimethyl-8-ribityllumazine synthase [Verrucomicrobiales bacterium]|nr:6,7-dimethyl-8-ribityllumazine synthase [Verrucomicrobiales bacterium]